MNSYFNMAKTNEKIIHLLYAGYVCDTYNDSKETCIHEFGEDATAKAEIEFDKIKSAFYKNKL